MYLLIIKNVDDLGNSWTSYNKTLTGIMKALHEFRLSNNAISLNNVSVTNLSNMEKLDLLYVHLIGN